MYEVLTENVNVMKAHNINVNIV